jgi:tetratricopeptide (TPR) repeat protein
MLAVTTGELGALDDAMAAWGRYLKLQPDDDIARREQGYVAAKMGQFEKGIVELTWFVSKHPDDPAGHYELGQAERSLDMTKALMQFDKALSLDPNYMAARTARGSLYYQQGSPEKAVTDLEAAASLRPEDAANLDRLGQTYQALDRTADAVRALRRAAELAPGDSKTLLHFARALADSGNTEESNAVMDRFRQLGPEKKIGVRAGFVDYLSLTDEQRHADYRTRLEKAVAKHPEDAALQVEYLKLLLQDGDSNRVAATARAISGMKPGAASLADAGRALLDGQRYELSIELLKLAETAAPAGNKIAGIELDLASATFRMGDPAGGLALLERVAESGRNGDYHLARAEMLDALGKSVEARTALAKALETSSDQPDLYRHAAAWLLEKGRASEAARLLDESARIWPQNREILLMKAATEELAGKTDDAEQSLKRIQNRWPEWSPAWAALGMILDVHGHFEDGEKALETAVALGARGPEVHFYLADCSFRSGSSGKDRAELAIGQALKLAPGDPWIAVLAGRIAFERGDHALAVDRLREAVRLRPGSVEAHSDLARAYRALGRQQEAEAELKEAGRLQKMSSGSLAAPPYLLGLIRESLLRRGTP